MFWAPLKEDEYEEEEEGASRGDSARASLEPGDPEDLLDAVSSHIPYTSCQRLRVVAKKAEEEDSKELSLCRIRLKLLVAGLSKEDGAKVRGLKG